MSEAKVRLFIVDKLYEQIRDGANHIRTVEFSTVPDGTKAGYKLLNAGSMKRYIPRRPLFNYMGDDEGYPTYQFIWTAAFTGIIKAQQCPEWGDIVNQCFNPIVLEHWMNLHTRPLATEENEQVRDLAATDFERRLRMLRKDRQISFEDKVQQVQTAITVYLNVAYGYKG